MALRRKLAETGLKQDAHATVHTGITTPSIVMINGSVLSVVTLYLIVGSER